MDRLLVLVRHGQSEWNLKNLFTGWKDPDLTEQGVREAHAAGQKLKARGFHFDIAYTSGLTRAQRTLSISHCERRKSGKEVRTVEPSRFIAELGDGLKHSGGKKAEAVSQEDALAKLAKLQALFAKPPAG